MEILMPQKRMAARGQSAKLAKGSSPKKTPAAKPLKVNKSAKASNKAAPVKKAEPAKKAKTAMAKPPQAAKTKMAPKSAPTKPVSAPVKAGIQPALPKAEVKPVVETRPPTLISKAKAALKKETASSALTKTRGRKISVDINPGEAATALSGKWSTLYKKAEQIEAKPYNMKAVFEEKTAIVHKVLGWGYILANRNDRLEVLFKDGIKYLISNYKP